jgi:2-amino-4-hydroxy-6-hydroxymethyldihydropteridine diphosphokinase
VFHNGGRKAMKKAKKKKVKKIIVKRKAAKKAVKKVAKKIVKMKAKKAAKKVIRKAAKKPVKKTASKKKATKITPVKTAKKERPLKKGPHIAYLGLGSNVGDREEYIEQAIFLLSKTPGIKIVKKSSNNETEAEGGGPDQPQFLNAAVQIQTMFDPYKLLSVLQETESALGREREVDWGPRTIDLDILLYDDQIISDDKLQIPHPLLHERVFVLKPLSEIAPKVVHPVLEKTIEDIYEERKNEIGEKYDDELPGFKKIKEGTPDDYERW